MLNLITSFYKSSNPSRDVELVKCLNENIRCPYIKKIHLFIDGKDIDYFKSINFQSDKIVIVSFNGQPKYIDFFKYSSKLDNELCMISNTDIYVKHVEDGILDILDDNLIYTLTRHEFNNTKPLINKYQGSHDCFIFKAPLKEELYDEVNIFQNIPGSEAIVIMALSNLGYHLYNPCLQIKIVHEHASGIRNYKGNRLAYSATKRYPNFDKIGCKWNSVMVYPCKYDHDLKDFCNIR